MNLARVTLLAVAVGTGRIQARAERRFWRLVALAYACA